MGIYKDYEGIKMVEELKSDFEWYPLEEEKRFSIQLNAT